MAVVGDAFVRVRVISSGLSNDIADAVRNGFRTASGDMDAEGERAGRRAGAATGRGIREEAVKGAKDTGERIAEDVGGNFRTRLLRDIKQQLPKNLQGGLRNAFRDAFKNIKNITPNSIGNGIGNSIRNSVRRSLSSLTPEKDFDFKAFRKAGQDLSTSLHEGFSLGIGKARMGKAVLSSLLLAAPSLISGAGAIGGAMASELVTFISAIGPGLAGSLGVAAAGFSTLALNFGLLTAAFKSKTPELDEAVDNLKEIGTLLGEPIALGMASAFGDFGNSLKSIIPQINDLLTETGEAFGRLFKSLGETVASAENLGRIRTILSTNLTFVDSFSKGLNGLATSFLILFAASKPFIDYIGQSIQIFGEWAANSLQVAEANGTLAAWMDRMLAKFTQLAGIVADFGRGIYNVFKAASDAGEGLLTRIQDIGARFAAWTGDTANQERMSAFFQKMDVLAHAVFETISSLFGAAGAGLENMNLQPILDFLTTIQTTVGPAIASIFKEIKEGAGPNLAEAFFNLGTALQKVADSGAVQTIAEGVSRIVLAATEFINTDFGSAIFAVVVPLSLFGGLISTILGPLSAVASVIGTLVSAGLLPLAAAIAATVGWFVLMYENSASLRDSLAEIGGVIADHVVAGFEKLKPLIEPLITAIINLAAAVGDKLGPAFSFIAPIIGVVIDKIVVIFQYIIAQATTFINLITAILTGDWSAAWDLAGEAVGNVWTLLKGLFGEIAAGIWGWIQGIGELLGAAWEAIENKVVEVWDAITSYFAGRWEEISTGFQTWISDVGNNISTGFSNVVGWISGAWDTVTTFFSDLWQGILGGISEFGGNLVNIFSTAWNNFTSFLSDLGEGLKPLWNAIWEIALVPLKITWNIIMLIWNGIKDFLFDAWDKIKTGAEVVWGYITGFFSTVWNGVQAVAEYVWNAITTSLTGAWNIIVTVATTIWGGLVSFFSTVWNGIQAVAEYVWNAITTSLTGAWNIIVSVAQTIWAGIVTFFTAIWTGIQAVTEYVWEAIITGLTGAWNIIVTVAQAVWAGIAAFFTAIWTGIQAVGEYVWNAIITGLTGAWNIIKSVAEAVWNGISAFFGMIWDAIGGTITRAYNDIIANLQQAWDTITGAVSSAWDAISGIASDLWGKVVSAIEDVVGPIVGTLQGWWDDITSAVSTAWDSLSGIVGTIWEGIKNAIVQPIEDAWKALVGWASDIAGVISGIVGAVNTAVTDVGSKLDSMLADQATAGTVANQFAQQNAVFGGGAAEGAIVPPIPGGWNMIVGEAGQTERIEPLDRQGLSKRDRALISHLVGQLAGSGNNSGSGGQIAVNVNLDGNMLGRFVESIVVDQQGQAGRRAARNRRTG